MFCEGYYLHRLLANTFEEERSITFILSIGWGKLLIVKFIYSEKATKFCKISTVDLSYVVTVKSMVEISQNFVAFSEYMNFTKYFNFLL